MTTEHRDLVTYLRKLRDEAGHPSARQIARAVSGISHTTVSEILNGTRRPSWESVARLGEFLSADMEILRDLWLAPRMPAIPKLAALNPNFDPLIFDDVVITARLKERWVYERTTERRITATSDGVDRYLVRAWAHNEDPSDDISGEEMQIEAVLNCSIDNVRMIRTPGSGITQMADVILPEVLSAGESCFFATRMTVFKSVASSKTDFLSYEVTGQYAASVHMRAQFEPGDTPQRCWIFTGGPDHDKWIEPDESSERIKALSSYGFVEHHFQELPAGTKVGLVWNWA